jgi:integral membrane protein
MMNTNLNTALGRFRTVAFLEGCSFLLFGLTMPLKYYFKMPMPNKIVGTIHGGLFLLYIVLLAIVAYKNKWRIIKIFLAFIASLIPFGTFYADKKLFRES